MRIAIRFTLPFDDKLKEYFNSFEQMVVYQHDADEEVSRTHVHALVETSVSTDTLKNRLQKILGYRLPKADWAFSMKGKDGTPIEDRFVTYMSKGKLQPIALKGFTQEQCDSYKGLWVEQSKPLREKKDLITSHFIAQELAQFMDEQAHERKILISPPHAITKEYRHEWYDVSPFEMIKQAIKIHNKYGKTYCDFSLIRVIQTAMGLSKRQKWNDVLVDSVYRKLFPE